MEIIILILLGKQVDKKYDNKKYMIAKLICLICI